MIHPGAWLLWALCGGLVAVSTTNPFYLVLLFAVAFFVHATCRRPGEQSRSFKLFALFGLATIATRTALVLFLPDITMGSVIEAALEGARLAVLLAVFGAFNSVSDPFAVLRLAPGRWHEPALAASLALSLAPRMIAAVSSVREAQRLRGIAVRGPRSLAALAVPVLANGMEEAVTVAESMDARGHGRGPRTRYRPQAWGWRSTVMVVTSGAAAASFARFLQTGTGDLAMTTFPLGWPSASAWLLGAVLLLASPALVTRSPDAPR